MKTIHKFTFALAGLAVIAVMPAAGQEGIDHYAGEKPDSIVQAFEYFAEYNEKVAAVLATEELDIDDLAAIHEMTYTLENSLEKIRQELDTLADTLEALHVASETADLQGTRSLGEAYLEQASVIRE